MDEVRPEIRIRQSANLATTISAIALWDVVDHAVARSGVLLSDVMPSTIAWRGESIIPAVLNTGCLRILPSDEIEPSAVAGGEYLELGVPHYVNGTLVSIVVFLIHSGISHQSVVEFWALDPQRAELRLDVGVYGQLVHFERISRQTVFPFGVGLPGKAWQERHAYIMEPLPESLQFLRSDRLSGTELVTGLGWPLFGEANQLLGSLLLLQSGIDAEVMTNSVWSVGQASGQVDPLCVSECGTGFVEVEEMRDEVIACVRANQATMSHATRSVYIPFGERRQRQSVLAMTMRRMR